MAIERNDFERFMFPTQDITFKTDDILLLKLEKRSLTVSLKGNAFFTVDYDSEDEAIRGYKRLFESWTGQQMTPKPFAATGD